MKTISFAIVLCFLLLSEAFTTTAANLTISDPRKTWYTYPGTIEDMQITVKPHGAYFEIGMFLKISPVGSIYSSEKDTLEAVLNFESSDYSFINDSWLFINDSVYIRARLLDRYTAGLIYEGIVKRRKDPSIVFKNEQGTYQVRIFPMAGNSSRTIKINYFVPAEWYGSYARVQLPLSLLNLSYKKPAGAKIFVYPDTYFTNPGFGPNLAIKFNDINHRNFGNVKEGFVAYQNISNDYLYFNHSNSGGVFANTIQTEKGNFYQVVINPSVLNAFVIPKKVAYLIDYNTYNSNYLKADVFKAIKECIYKQLKPTDSFNIFLSNDNIVRLSKRWIKADSASVEHYFENLTDLKLGSVTNLENLLYSAIEWVNTNSDSADIVLVANTAYKGGSEFFNNIINKCLGLSSKNIRISVVSYIRYNNIINNIAGTSYKGNNYLYTALTAQTKGYFISEDYYYNTLSSMLSTVMTNLIGGYEKLSAHISFNNGFAYDRVSINDTDIGSIVNNTNYIEIGKFEGSGPISIELSGYYRKQPFFRKFEVNNTSSTVKYDCRSMWAAGYMIGRELLSNKTPLTIYDIINVSLGNRILSIYTAFLATDNDELDTLGNQNDSDEDDDDNDGDLMPVELVYFDGKSREGGIDLSWATASEINNYGFIVDKKMVNEPSWDDIAFVEGKGNSKSISYYHYFDTEVSIGTTYQYRLRQMDLDGKINHAGSENTGKNEVIVTVRYDAEYNLSLAQNYPNPMSDLTVIRFTLPQNLNTRLEILDITGKVITTLVNGELAGGEHEISWQGKDSNLEKLPAGTYICRLTAGGESRTIKINIHR